MASQVVFDPFSASVQARRQSCTTCSSVSDLAQTIRSRCFGVASWAFQPENCIGHKTVPTTVPSDIYLLRVLRRITSARATLEETVSPSASCRIVIAAQKWSGTSRMFVLIGNHSSRSATHEFRIMVIQVMDSRFQYIYLVVCISDH